MADLFITFMVTYPHILLILVPILVLTGYLWGRSHNIPIYDFRMSPGTGIVVEAVEFTEEELVQEGELIESILDEAVVQVLPEETGAIHIIPVTRISLNRWNKKEGEANE